MEAKKTNLVAGEAKMAEGQQWYVLKGKVFLGPFTAKQLRELAQSQKISDETLIKLGDSGELSRAGKIPGLFQSMDQNKSSAVQTNNSTLIACEDCRGMVSKRAKSCPHCGAPLIKQDSDIFQQRGVFDDGDAPDGYRKPQSLKGFSSAKRNADEDRKDADDESYASVKENPPARSGKKKSKPQTPERSRRDGTIPCRACGNGVTHWTNKCPQCGTFMPSVSGSVAFILAIVVISGFLVIIQQLKVR